MERESDIIDQFPGALKALASQGTIEETAMFLSRATDESIGKFFKVFWNGHKIQDEFVECATLLIERVSKMNNPPKTIIWELLKEREMELLKYPKLLAQLHSIDIKIHFNFYYLEDAVKDDQVFEGALERFDEISLSVNGIVLDRILQLLNVSVHEMLKASWTKKYAGYTQSKYAENFLFLKKWKLDHPEEVAALLAISPLEEVVINSPKMIAGFDEESKELIRAYVLLGLHLKDKRSPDYF